MATIQNNSVVPLTYNLTYAGVPFLVDEALVLRMPHAHSEPAPPDELLPPRKHQPETFLTEELKRINDELFMLDMDYPTGDPGRNLDALAVQMRIGPGLGGQDAFKYNTWFYPTGARRWSVFRGLATSTQMKAMYNACTAGSPNNAPPNSWAPQTFIMQCVPLDPISGISYTISTQMYMLPARCIAEPGGTGFDGLYLITLVDERFWWQWSPISASPVVGLPQTDTWTGLISFIGTVLGVNISYSALPAVYGIGPEPDSQFWTNQENAALLLDAVAFNLGRVPVRNYDGSYSLLNDLESQTAVAFNRGNADEVVRTAGGDMFNSGAQLLPAGDLNLARSAIVPPSVNVTFPIYVQGDDPVPHFSNPRNIAPRPSCWQEDSYGDVYIVNVPISSGGPFVSGLAGTVGSGFVGADPGLLISGRVQAIQTTAKALVASEATDLVPLNLSGMTALAMQLTSDYYSNQVVAALDETYPGTIAWIPDGVHDVLWTWSAKSRQGTTRAMRGEWNSYPKMFQHRTPAVVGFNDIPKGVGGPSVAQSWDDSVSGSIFTTQITSTLLSGQYVTTLADVSTLPTQNKWKGYVGTEIVLFEGTSGGLGGGGSFLVGIRDRGIDGTLTGNWPNGTVVQPILPHATYGVNRVKAEKMLWTMPGTVTSGGVTSLNVIPQTQTVQCTSSNPTTINGIVYYPGLVNAYDTAQAFNAYASLETVWIRDRNDAAPTPNTFYNGQFAGFSASPGGGGGTAPVYLIDASSSPTTGSGTNCGKMQAFNFNGASDVPVLSPWSKLSVSTPTGLSLSSPGPCEIRMDFGASVQSGGPGPGPPPYPGCYILYYCPTGPSWVPACFPLDSYNLSEGGESRVLSPWGTLTADNATGLHLDTGSNPCEIVMSFQGKPPGGGTGSVKGWEWYLSKSPHATVPALTPWYHALVHNHTWQGGATYGLSALEAVALPFICTRGPTIKFLGANVAFINPPGTMNIYWGIYSNKSDSSPYPDKLLNGNVFSIINATGDIQTLNLGTAMNSSLVWLVFYSDVGGSMGAITFTGGGQQTNLLGSTTIYTGTGFNTFFHITIAPFAPLPLTFPAGASVVATNTFPAIAVQFGA